MRRKLNTVLSFAAALVFSSVALVQEAAALPTVSIELMDSNIVVGESFDVKIWTDGDGIGEDLLAFGFDVSSGSGAIFTYDSYTIESGFDDDSFGTINVAGSVFPGISDDDVLLATLSFTALAVGTDTLSVEGIFDGFFSGLYYADMSVFDISALQDITVEPVPEPATMLLFGTGIAGLAGNCWRKRKKNQA